MTTEQQIAALNAHFGIEMSPEPSIEEIESIESLLTVAQSDRYGQLVEELHGKSLDYATPAECIDALCRTLNL